ncbi:MAG: AAA family ATPase [Pseudomonadota bacterium]
MAQSTAAIDHRAALPPSGGQAEVIAFLSDPATYGHGVEQVERIDTHGAIVFLAGEMAYKIKRAVRLPYLDFSTLALRAEACEREFSLNRRSAPEIYRETLPIVRGEDGKLHTSGRGKVVEWAVVMRRFKQSQLFDVMARDGRLTDRMMAELTDRIVGFHDLAEPLAPDPEGPSEAKRMTEIIAETVAELTDRPDLFPPDLVAAYDRAWQAQIASLSGALDRRRAEGWVRHCHGDLHLGNICLHDGRPTLFDCLEFSDSLATTDVLYDLAFLHMDLEHRHLGGFANLVLNRYHQARDSFDGLALLPLFLSTRASIRAKVAASAEAAQSASDAAESLRTAARRYLEETCAYLEPAAPKLVAVGGLSGSGKTSLARRLAPLIGPAPGAIHLRSDVLRKRLHGVDELERLPPEAYSQDRHEEVYEGLLERARAVLAEGHGIVLDAVYSKPDGRAAIEDLAREAGVPFVGFWLSAPEETMVERVLARRNDASDATAAVVRSQLSEDTGEISWHQVPAAGSPDNVLARARALLDAPSD